MPPLRSATDVHGIVNKNLQQRIFKYYTQPQKKNGRQNFLLISAIKNAYRLTVSLQWLKHGTETDFIELLRRDRDRDRNQSQWYFTQFHQSLFLSLSWVSVRLL